jgi:hypothetical protein
VEKKIKKKIKKNLFVNFFLTKALRGDFSPLRGAGHAVA